MFARGFYNIYDFVTYHCDLLDNAVENKKISVRREVMSLAT